MKISIIGTGNVATILGMELKKAGHEIVSVFGRQFNKTANLAVRLHAAAIHEINECIPYKADIILIAVNDGTIKSISDQLKKNKSIIVHTSGSIDLSVLSKKHKHSGIFYPLQTISTGSKINFKTTPLCVEANQPGDLKLLLQLASSISKAVYVIDSKQRLQVHLAAVFANNFSNHLMTVAEKILEENHLPFDLLKPIIYTAAKSLQNKSPSLLQTGPAVRGDRVTINKHLSLLKKHPSWKKLYELMSADISASKS